MNELTGHHVNEANKAIRVVAEDEPGDGGAHHLYCLVIDMETGERHVRLAFQNGPIKEAGVNGVTNEALLEVLISRMEGFVSGPYNTPDNEKALECLKGAREAFNARTREREERGVEGTHEE